MPGWCRPVTTAWRCAGPLLIVRKVDAAGARHALAVILA